MEISNLHIESLKGYEHNTRTHSEDQIQQIAGSISEFGFTNPILIDGDQRIIAGHGRLYAAKALGMDTVPCISLDHLSDVQVRALVIADNQIAMNAGWDEGLLATELDRLQTDGVDIDLLGFDVDTLEELLKPVLIEIEGLTDEDAIPEVEESICKAGDIWVLGNHRLLCGDATKKEDVDKLMDGNKADMVFTDPPYGIGYEYNTHQDTQGGEYLKFCDSFWNVLKTFSELIVITTGWKYKKFWWNKNPTDCIYWFCKNKTSGGKASYLRKVEPVFIFGEIIKRYKEDYFEVLNNYNNEVKGLHTCPKPIELLQELIVTQTKTSSNVLDVFLGSGSTLIVCEKTGRKCYGMEIDPHYCDVIVKRWQDYTGQQAIHAESEKPWQSV